jgi:hypothetical protein
MRPGSADIVILGGSGGDGEAGAGSQGMGADKQMALVWGRVCSVKMGRRLSTMALERPDCAASANYSTNIFKTFMCLNIRSKPP